MVTPGANGSCRLDTVTKTKTVQVIQQAYDVGTEARRFAETLYRWCKIRFGTVYTRRIVVALCVRAGTADTGARVSASLAHESRSDGLAVG
jgi:hypothetical protein